MKNLLKIVFVALAFLSISFVSIEKKDFVVVIDAGHGGHDIGANHNEFLEKELVSAISQKVAKMNADKNVKIYFTRSTDDFVELQKRVEMINEIKPDMVLSLHVNKNKNIETNGFEVFVSDKNENLEKSNLLANQLVSTLENTVPLTNRGVKKGPFFVLTNSKAPAILLEIGFISNEKDRDFVTNDNGQTQIAQSILDFVNTIKN
jgi:N-acetylmuramoyl-L-alanine amidase